MSFWSEFCLRTGSQLLQVDLKLMSGLLVLNTLTAMERGNLHWGRRESTLIWLWRSNIYKES